MSKSKLKRSPFDLVQDLHQPIEDKFESLDDNDYIEAMENVISFCESCIEAKKEEMRK